MQLLKRYASFPSLVGPINGKQSPLISWSLVNSWLEYLVCFFLTRPFCSPIAVRDVFAKVRYPWQHLHPVYLVYLASWSDEKHHMILEKYYQ